ncbi:MAG: hypothetical protein QM639_07845 [Rhodocyclaceae bacterium]
MAFVAPPLHDFARSTSPDDLHHYVDGLALLDDLLCLYAQPPRWPLYQPMTSGADEAGSPALITERFADCLEAIRSHAMKDCLDANFSYALTLRDTADASRDDIQSFLDALLQHYGQITHPALYPEGLSI